MSDATLVLSAHAIGTLLNGCEREFALKYKARRYWPAGDPTALEEPRSEADTFLGTAFHILVQQHALGLDVAPFVAALAEDAPKLPDVWARFLASEHAVPPPGARTWDEQALHVVVDGVPILARVDRIVHGPDGWLILDWKTGRPKADKLRAGWQAKVYPYALVEAGHALPGGAPVRPDEVRLVFWDVERGEAIEVPYDAATHAEVGAQLAEVARKAMRPFDAAAADCPNFKRRARRCGGCGFDQLCNPRFGEVPRPAPLPPPAFTLAPPVRGA